MLVAALKDLSCIEENWLFIYGNAATSLTLKSL